MVMYHVNEDLGELVVGDIPSPHRREDERTPLLQEWVPVLGIVQYAARRDPTDKRKRELVEEIFIAYHSISAALALATTTAILSTSISIFYHALYKP